MSVVIILINCVRLAVVSNGAVVKVADRATERIRVACIGDSITYGQRINDREHASYPARLQSLLGDKYEVRNFGVSGATLINGGTRPYAQQSAFRDTLKFRPDVAVIMLGTNDTNTQTWPDHQHDFVGDYSDLIDTLRKASPGIQIWLCLPPPLVRDRGKAWDTDAILSDQVIPKIKSIANESKTELIDLNSIFGQQAAILPDGVHPNADGAELMARTVYDSVQKKPAFKSSHE
ncbi:MAG TPA: GDSL-type esterase/lipase family protein [Lacipirellulaceae bacterium]|jgi:sialate O-acetylesterase|nr:GDSL-type esterase/lipase family protein [Lacipirellulaceae bacterium]